MTIVIFILGTIWVLFLMILAAGPSERVIMSHNTRFCLTHGCHCQVWHHHPHEGPAVRCIGSDVCAYCNWPVYRPSLPAPRVAYLKEK